METKIENTIITINGKNYKLVEIEEKTKDCPTTAVVSLVTPMGKISKTYPLFSKNGEPCFGVAEGEYNHHGDKFVVKYMTDDELAEMKKDAIDLDDVPPILRVLLEMSLCEMDEED